MIQKMFLSTGVSIVKVSSSSIPTKTLHVTTRPVPHARDMLPEQKRTSRRNTQICSLRDFSRCCCCCCLSWSACGHAARLASIRTKPHRFWYCCRQPTITPRPFPATAIFRIAECTRVLCRVALPYQTTLPVGCTRLAAVRLIAKCADMFPLVSDYLHICFLLDLLLQLLLLLPLLLSRRAHSHAARLKIPLPLRMTRVPTIILLSRGFSCCCTSQLRLHHRKVPTMGVQQPSLQHLRWVAIVPHRTSFAPRARVLVFISTSLSRARPCSNTCLLYTSPSPRD